jgi:prolyl-tRNA synthetase
MRQSKLFTKTSKTAPSGEVAKNAKLLVQAGFVDKLSAGVYTLLPLGFRVFKNIERVIREEMNAIGGQELLMPALHPKENWEATGRWETMDDLYKIKDASDREFALGATHEEIIVPLVKQFVSSYRDLPFAAYQIQTKFRMELRAKSGILRGKEFAMKDLYSFHTNEADLDAYYDTVAASYKKIFERVGLGDRTYFTFASGGSFSKYSHEFQTLTDAGEDIIYICDKCKVAINKEIIKEQNACPSCGATDLHEEKAVEVGNIFKLKTKYSDPFKLVYKDETGVEQSVIMGCYGIGLGRILGTIVEVLADEKGLSWPKEVAPFSVHLVSLGKDAEAETLYNELSGNGVSVLYDDRDVSAGAKFADADLIGIPCRVVVSGKSIAAGGAEIKERTSDATNITSFENIISQFSK